MQNIDYSKKISLDNRKQSPSREIRTWGSSHLDTNKITTSRRQVFMNMIQSEGNSLSFLYLFVGAILFFTSGLVVGMKIDQKENYFTKNETNSFSNPGIDRDLDENSEESTPETQTSSYKQRDALKKPSKTKGNLKYPPLENHTNYIIQVGAFSLKDANKWGRYLIKNNQNFQGRLFRTSTGKLYLGYYYDKQAVKSALKYVRKLNGGVFSGASAKRIRF